MQPESAAGLLAQRRGGFGRQFGHLSLALLALVLLTTPLQAQWGGYAKVIHDWNIRQGEVRFGILEVQLQWEGGPRTNYTSVFVGRRVLRLETTAKSLLAITFGSLACVGLLTWIGRRLTMRH
jgi:hypothetical protein